jgi:hypothetical protein
MRRRTVVTVLTICGMLLFGMSASTPVASAGTKACGKVAAATGGKARVAAVKTNCRKARKVAIGYYKRQDRNPWDWDGKDPYMGIFYKVGGYKCFTGLGGSQAFCMAGKRRIFASTRPGDRPAQWR